MGPSIEELIQQQFGMVNAARKMVVQAAQGLLNLTVTTEELKAHLVAEERETYVLHQLIGQVSK